MEEIAHLEQQHKKSVACPLSNGEGSKIFRLLNRSASLPKELRCSSFTLQRSRSLGAIRSEALFLRILRALTRHSTTLLSAMASSSIPSHVKVGAFVFFQTESQGWGEWEWKQDPWMCMAVLENRLIGCSFAAPFHSLMIPFQCSSTHWLFVSPSQLAVPSVSPSALFSFTHVQERASTSLYPWHGLFWHEENVKQLSSQVSSQMLVYHLRENQAHMWSWVDTPWDFLTWREPGQELLIPSTL